MLSELCEAMKTNTYVRSFSLVATKSGDPIANVRLAAVSSPLPIPCHALLARAVFLVTLGGAVPIMSYMAALRDPLPLPLWLTTLKFQGISPKTTFSSSLDPASDLNLHAFTNSPTLAPQGTAKGCVPPAPLCLSSVTYEPVPNPNTSPYHPGGS